MRRREKKNWTIQSKVPVRVNASTNYHLIRIRRSGIVAIPMLKAFLVFLSKIEVTMCIFTVKHLD